MNTAPFHWGRRPGLAGGIDKSGEQAAALLAAGFAAVEFGTVTPQPVPGEQPGVAALAVTLARLGARGDSAIGIGLGMTPGAAPPALHDDWLYGLQQAAPVADYLSCNLSARAYRPLLAAEHDALLRQALTAMVRERDRLAAVSGRRLALALKLPLASLRLAVAAATAGFDALILVRPDATPGGMTLRGLAHQLQGGPALIAVGGIRHAADVRAALATGAHGVQVHRLFAERGPACLAMLGDDVS